MNLIFYLLRNPTHFGRFIDLVIDILLKKCSHGKQKISCGIPVSNMELEQDSGQQLEPKLYYSSGSSQKFSSLQLRLHNTTPGAG
jgi:hypothetical protein